MSKPVVSVPKSEGEFRDLVVPALIFYAVLYGLFFSYEGFYAGFLAGNHDSSENPLPAQFPLFPYLLVIGRLASESRNSVSWRLIIKASLFITLLTISLAYFYQLARDTLDPERLAVFPISAVLLMAIVAMINAGVRTRPMQWLGQRWLEIVASRWFRGGVTVVLLGAAIFFVVYGEFFTGNG